MTYYVIICPSCSNKYKKDYPSGKAFCDFCQCVWEYRAKYVMGNSIHSLRSIQEIKTVIQPLKTYYGKDAL